MTSINVAADGWCPELDLVANQITTITFADDVESIEVIVIDNTAPVRWTCDGSNPTEDAGFYIPRDGVDERQPPTAGPTVVKLWTSGTAKACVQRG